MSSQKKDQTKQNQAKQELLRITLKALKDESYKERLIVNPKEAIQEVSPGFNEDVVNIVVQDQTSEDTLYLNISPLEASLLYETLDDIELNEEDLEMVAGGMVDDNGNCGCHNNGFTCWLNDLFD